MHSLHREEGCAAGTSVRFGWDDQTLTDHTGPEHHSHAALFVGSPRRHIHWNRQQCSALQPFQLARHALLAWWPLPGPTGVCNWYAPH
jgi:hypothetical protein